MVNILKRYKRFCLTHQTCVHKILLTSIKAVGRFPITVTSISTHIHTVTFIFVIPIEATEYRVGQPSQNRKFSLNTPYSISSEILRYILLKLFFSWLFIQLYGLADLKVQTEKQNRQTSNSGTRDRNCYRIMVTKSTLYIKILLYIIILLVYP